VCCSRRCLRQPSGTSWRRGGSPGCQQQRQ
jgi:hypothetical protein